ncbi:MULTISPECIES: hypothetical protein [unclassified Micromonospora]|uniref:hypothetical protein n=1 Tax=unclassified Micromonospora TaxID=2617518 RepID=UPI00098D5042|nr:MULTISPECIES: hypothetical protein [unclassified Micromonospora]MDI5938290.1 hypothetical protein [Micromonospora sp. DH15]OON27131.1 hypothetical protein BSA16_33535 [Micromonospora sp. Rc5]
MTVVTSLLLSVAVIPTIAVSPADASGCRSAPYSASLSVTDVFDQYNGVEVFSHPTSGTYRTTTQCRDIQIRNTGDGKVSGPFHACVVFAGRATCNYWTYVPAGQWRNLAVDVKDGTRFYIWISINLSTYYSAKATGDW